MIESVVPGGSQMDDASTSQPGQFDKSLALERVGGDPDLLREVAELFLADYPLSLEKIRQAIAAGDPFVVERQAHGLKGSVANFGAQDVFEAAFALEKKGRGKDLTGVADDLLRLEHTLETLRPELEALTTE